MKSADDELVRERMKKKDVRKKYYSEFINIV